MAMTEKERLGYNAAQKKYGKFLPNDMYKYWPFKQLGALGVEGAARVAGRGGLPPSMPTPSMPNPPASPSYLGQPAPEPPEPSRGLPRQALQAPDAEWPQQALATLRARPRETGRGVFYGGRRWSPGQTFGPPSAVAAEPFVGRATGTNMATGEVTGRRFLPEGMPEQREYDPRLGKFITTTGPTAADRASATRGLKEQFSPEQRAFHQAALERSGTRSTFDRERRDTLEQQAIAQREAEAGRTSAEQIAQSQAAGQVAASMAGMGVKMADIQARLKAGDTRALTDLDEALIKAATDPVDGFNLEKYQAARDAVMNQITGGEQVKAEGVLTGFDTDNSGTLDSSEKDAATKWMQDVLADYDALDDVKKARHKNNPMVLQAQAIRARLAKKKSIEAKNIFG